MQSRGPSRQMAAQLGQIDTSDVQGGRHKHTESLGFTQIQNGVYRQHWRDRIHAIYGGLPIWRFWVC